MKKILFTILSMLALVFSACSNTVPEAIALAVPGPPASCSAVENATHDAVEVTWTPPAGSTTLNRYAIKIKAQATPVVQVSDLTARSYTWTTAYDQTSVFQVRAANSAGPGPWCEA